MRILYLEDNLINLALMERVTNTKNHQMISCVSAEEALVLLQKEQVDIIVADIRLAGEMDGIQFTQHLREIGDSRPVILTTAYEALYSRQDALAAGCDEFLTKPISIHQILSLLAQYSNHR
jgi:two-component system, cell cycle response regulator DivK